MNESKRRSNLCCENPRRKFAKQFQFHRGTFDPYKDKVIDPRGYFLIRINREKQEIELAHCTHDHIIQKGVRGKNAEEVYTTAIKMGMVTALEYAAYLGAELKKADYALRYGLEYVQE